jgi:two-component system, LytTR family, sensor kinase
MLTPGTAELLHVVGYLTGASLYAMLLAMAGRTGRRDPLLAATALLGLGWNVGELAAHAADGLALDGAGNWLSAASYAALGLLAAVAVHSASAAPGGGDSATHRQARRLVVATAYACAGLAALLQAVTAARGEPLPSSPALMLLTAGLAAVTVPLIVLTRRQAHGRRALWMTALALFAVSALHLSRYHGTAESWTMELLGHHASIPLAFAILYQDYRFALADLFLKRALALLALVGVVFALWSGLAPILLIDAAGGLRPEGVGLLLAAWVATVLLFPLVRRGIGDFVDQRLLRRTDYAALTDECAALVQQRDSAEGVLDAVCDRLAPAVGAGSVTWRRAPALAPLDPHEVAVPTAEPPHYVLTVGRLAGGRRLLSDDEAMLERMAFLIARRIDALRLSEERYARMIREHEIANLATEAELRALRAQINPHFLFNALTTIGYLIQQAPPRALDTLMRLTTLLRAVLRSEGEFTTLGQERELIASYLEIERERFEERLSVEVDLPDALTALRLPALILQPLVENAIKHGIARARAGGEVAVTGRLDAAADGATLRLQVRNTGAPLQPAGGRSEGAGIGLRNVSRRLEHYYGGAAALTVTTAGDGATVAEIRLPVGAAETMRLRAAERVRA